MTTTDLLDRLAAHRTLSPAPRQELAWLVAHGSLLEMQSGDVLTAAGAKPMGLIVVLSGRIAIFVDRGGGLHKMMEWGEGDVTGTLPYSRMTSPPGPTIVQEPTTLLSVPRDHFPEMIRECHQITAILVHTMLDRARAFTSSDLHNEKMASLGRLSAGLAHELNNPAAAIERSASLLDDRMADVERATRELAAAGLTAPQLAALDRFRGSCLTRIRGVRSPIEQAEREEAIADWLEDHGCETDIGDALAETTVTFEALDALAANVQGSSLGAVLRWAAAGCTVRSLASEIQDAATRISGLVVAIKGFTHMDQATVAEPVDLVKGLDNTVTVLRSKARSKSASVVVDVEPNLPHVMGFAGELNQIWDNLINNALDAIAEGGRVDVQANRDHQFVIVRVIDNGSGIPDKIRDRIFDPFFTTKPVGLGTGLGLDIVRRLIRHNEGDIAVESRPGRTEFRVVLRIADAKAAGAAS
jgi:signal transduction histidine kinase